MTLEISSKTAIYIINIWDKLFDLYTMKYMLILHTINRAWKQLIHTTLE